MASLVTTRFSFEECSTGEPSLEDLFAEPIVQLVMERDRVNVKDMRLQLDRFLRAHAA